MTVSNNVGIDSTERNFHWESGSSVFRNNTSCRFNVSGTNDKVVGDADGSNQFWTGANGSGAPRTPARWAGPSRPTAPCRDLRRHAGNPVTDAGD